MSLHLEFEPHSWYMGFAIKKDSQMQPGGIVNHWQAYTAEEARTARLYASLEDK
jgi:hypothetical protein